MTIYTFNGVFNSARFLDDLIDAGVDPAEVVVTHDKDAQTLFVKTDNAALESVINATAAAHNAAQPSYAQQREQSRQTILNLFELDASDRTFLVQLTQGFELAVSDRVAPRTVYNALRSLVDASPKHRDEINYWFELEEGVTPDGLLTVLQKRAYVKCVRRYYVTKLAPALTVWLLGNRITPNL